MEAPPKLLYPALVVAAISVTLFSLLGIATLTGYLPLAQAANAAPMPAAASNAAPVATAARTTLTEAGPVTTPAAPHVAAGPTPTAHATPQHRNACTGCGTIESITAIERKGESSGLGAVAGGLTGALLGNQMGKGNGRTGMAILGGAGGAYVGNHIEQNMHRTTSWRVNVRMEDGRLRTLYQQEAPAVAVGRHVEIVGNSIVPLG